MKSRASVFFWVFLVSFAASLAYAQQAEYLDSKPLLEVVRVKAQPVSQGPKERLPLITWGGDVATIFAFTDGIFASEGVDVELFVENNFTKQVEAFISGKTPYLRGTAGMINSAVEVAQAQGIEIVVFYQMTWSVGGDTMVVRSHINKPADLKGKTIALQLYGPHVDYVANILNSANVPLSSVKSKWFRELTLPTYDAKGRVVDPVSAFQADKTIDAVMCIIPDALLLTGKEGGVSGSKILLTTKTASRIISDVYAVRKDYFDANRSKVEKITRALLKGQERLSDLLKNPSAQKSKSDALIRKSAELLLDSATATGDIEALLGDCEFVGFNGNLQFFTGKGTTRNFQTLTNEIQTSFIQMGFLAGKVALLAAEWDYSTLASGLKYATNVPVSTPKFDRQKVETKVAQKYSVEATSWAEEGSLFFVEINFKPNQSDFSEAIYAEKFKKAVETVQTYGGALVIVEGHSDPEGIRRARNKGENDLIISQMEQQAKNLSLQRSRVVLQSFVSYANKRGLKLDESQFVSMGLGVASPRFRIPKTSEEWEANMRVVFRIKQVEAELAEFTPEKQEVRK